MSYIDIMPDYIPFMVQCKGITGAKTDPEAIFLRIFEEDNGTFSSADILDEALQDGLLALGDFSDEFSDEFAKFPVSKINSKMGLYGILVPKSIFSAKKQYRIYWTVTIGGITTAKEEQFSANNSTSFQE